jgi:hypothetical protein
VDKQNESHGVSGTAWGIVGILALVTGLLALCALVVMMFSANVGPQVF